MGGATRAAGLPERLRQRFAREFGRDGGAAPECPGFGGLLAQQITRPGAA